MAAPSAGEYLYGDEPTIADICLVPQMYNARRFDVPVDDFPDPCPSRRECPTLDAFRRSTAPISRRASA